MSRNSKIASLVGTIVLITGGLALGAPVAGGGASMLAFHQVQAH